MDYFPRPFAMIALQNPSVDASVLVCTWNNSKLLDRTLASMSRFDVPTGLRYEIVVVNNNCSDDTETVIERWRGILPINYIIEPRQGLSRARNAGLAAAIGSLIIFTDDDVLLEPHWLRVYWEVYSEHGVRSFYGGSVVSDYEGEPPDSRIAPYAPWSVIGLHLGPHTRYLRPEETFLAANWACDRSAILAAGGFNELLGLDPSSARLRVGEETDLMNRLRAAGMVAYYLPQATLRHFVPAAKCCVRHIAGRLGAAAYLDASAVSQERVSRIFGIPRWMYRRAACLLFRYVVRRVGLLYWKQAYIAWHVHIERMRGQRDAYLANCRK
jgi:glycosyltransferase involved in cell wall biosynthesis